MPRFSWRPGRPSASPCSTARAQHNGLRTLGSDSNLVLAQSVLDKSEPGCCVLCGACTSESRMEMGGEQTAGSEGEKAKLGV